MNAPFTIDRAGGGAERVALFEQGVEFDFLAIAPRATTTALGAGFGGFIGGGGATQPSDQVVASVQERESDFAAARNHGVTEDRRVLTREGHLLRIVDYTDPQTGEQYEFLTNELDLPAGVIVELYRRRWEAEKAFDEIKNKLGEKKAWATSLVAKEAQAQLVAITHNLLLSYEQTLETEHGVTNQAEDKRRAKRTQGAAKKCTEAGQPLSALVVRARRATQRSVKFVRWIRQSTGVVHSKRWLAGC